MSTDDLKLILDSAEVESAFSELAQALISLVRTQNPLLSSSGNRIPAKRHLETMSFRLLRDPSLAQRAEGTRETIERLEGQRNDILLIKAEVSPVAFIVLLDADTKKLIGLYREPTKRR